MTPLKHLVKVLQLGTPSPHRYHTYINGESLYFPTGRVYGGQVIAQSVIAAAKTVPGGRLPHSIHGYFIAAGDIPALREKMRLSSERRAWFDKK